MGELGRVLIVAGGVLLAIGLVLVLGLRVPWLGRLPGDFTFGGPHTRVYVPLGTSLLVSIVLTLLLRLFFRR